MDDTPRIRFMPEHDLHTPVTSILIYARLLADDPRKSLSEEEVGFIAGIHQAGAMLFRRIDEFLGRTRTSP